MSAPGASGVATAASSAQAASPPPTPSQASSASAWSAAGSASSSASTSAGSALPAGGQKPLDTVAIGMGFAGPYRFVAHLDGIPGLMTLGGTVNGAVTDAQHFVLDFPESTFITRYTRDGSSARAIVNGRTMAVQPGIGTEGAMSPEALLPQGLWAKAVSSWQDSLLPSGLGGTYTASTARLVHDAEQAGILASDWQLGLTLDRSGRLVTLGFSGRSWDQPFSLDVVILYA